VHAVKSYPYSTVKSGMHAVNTGMHAVNSRMHA